MPDSWRDDYRYAGAETARAGLWLRGILGSLRTYYDHERAYARIAAAGGSGWDDLPSSSGPQTGSYAALDAFLASPFAVPGDAVELGCGGGQACIKLAAHGYRVVGVDFAPTAIELARRNAPELQFMVGDCLALELAAASCDLAVDNHVLHCILGADRARFLLECARILRPGGLLFSDTMSRDGLVAFETYGFDPTTFVHEHKNRYLVGATELDAELAAAGFEIVVRDARPDPASIPSLVRVARRV